MLVCVLGLPGSGKSTLLRALAGRLGAQVLHPGRHAREKGLVDSGFPSRAELLAVPNLTESLLSAIAKLAPDLVLLDGFPRSREQAKKLVATGWSLLVIHLVFPADEELEWSVARQDQRVRADGVFIERRELETQTRLAMEHDIGAVDELTLRGATIVEIDATQDASAVEASVLRLLPEESIAGLA